MTPANAPHCGGSEGQPIIEIRCGNKTKRGGGCLRWVTVGSECPNHGLPFVIKYPDPDDLWDQAITTQWKNVNNG